MENQFSGKNKQKICVVIPAFRVEKEIQAVISSIPAWVDGIIVVNDASPDSTQAVVESISDPRLHLVNHVKNQGVGGAMLTGYQTALQQGYDVIVKVDGDGQMDTAFLPLLIEPILNGQAEYTKGNRFLHPIALLKMPFMRRLGNLALTFMTKLASGYWNIFDPTNGYTAICADKLQALDPKKISKNYFFESSMLCELRNINAVVMDIAIPAVYQNENSSVNIPREFFIFLANLTSRCATRIFNRYFLYDFNAGSSYFVAGSILGLFGGIWGIVKWVQSAEKGVTASTGTVLIAVLPIILGIQFLIQAVALDIADVPTKVQKTKLRSDQDNLWTQPH